MNPRRYPLRITLCGFAGSGKSSIAPRLARRLGYKVVDTDQVIAKQNKSAVADIFRRFGEKRFRKMEAETILKALGQSSRVIALGGGSLLNRKLASTIAGQSCLIYLSCSKRELSRRLRGQTDRPLLVDATRSLEARIEYLLRKRTAGYEIAPLKISTSSKSIGQCVTSIMKKLNKRYPE